MKKYLIMLLVPFMVFTSCVEDTSAYLPQEKEDVNVDNVTPDAGGGEEPEPVDGVLTPGVHLLKINVGGVERRYKYFMPVSLDDSKPISLIFEFHGSYTVEEDAEIPDPIADISNTHTLNQLASKENCIVIFPAGTFNGGSVDWSEDGYMKSIPFVDAIIEKMKTTTPRVDFDRVYSTGQSSGAIFSWVLAFHRPDVFAAIAPRAGRMNVENETSFPSRAVPVRAFLGTVDDKVDHTAAVKDITLWAEKISGYFPVNMVKVDEAFEVEKYNKKITTRKFNGAKAPIEIYSIIDEGHNVPVGYMSSYIWEFFKANVRDLSKYELFATAADSSIVADNFDKFEIPFNYTDGADLNIDAPADWSPVVNNKVLSLTAPDFYDCDNREGEIVITATKGGKSQSVRIKYKLNVPKNYYSIGDIYYENEKPIGVVVWIGRNPRDAKIVSYEKIGQYGTMYYCGNGSSTYWLGKDFSTPDRNDGEGNTKAMCDRAKALAAPLDKDNAAFVWATEYMCNGVGGWYLPAIGEFDSIGKNLDKINAAIKTLNGEQLSAKIYSSTVEFGGKGKYFYFYDFAAKKIGYSDTDNEYFGFIRPIAMKKVTMK